MEQMLVIVHFADGDMGKFEHVISSNVQDQVMYMKHDDGEETIIPLRNVFQISVVEECR